MLDITPLADRPDFQVQAVTCRQDHKRWSATEVSGGYRLVLVRRGRFRRATAGEAADLDPTVGYLGVPHDEERFAHPHGGDVCTAIGLSPRLWRTMAGEGARVARRTMYVDARTLVGAARAAILEDDPAAAGLLPLADQLGVSPFRLSRAFPRELGVSLTHYRNRVRVGRVLDRLEQGEESLSILAADLGYADQAHLCRTVRRHLGRTPTALRRLL